MKINEEDIFNFVYYPEKLKQEIKNYISVNKKLFEKEIKLCEATKNRLALNGESLRNIISLYKILALEVKNQSGYLIAADSINLDKSVKTETYVNKENSLFVKAVFYKDKTKIFVFSEDDNTVTDFKIILKPSELSFKIDSSSEPIELPAGLEIESINIEK